MYKRGTVTGWGQDLGRGVGGKVWRGKEVKRRRIGDGRGSQGRGVDIAKGWFGLKDPLLEKFEKFCSHSDDHQVQVQQMCPQWKKGQKYHKRDI